MGCLVHVQKFASPVEIIVCIELFVGRVGSLISTIEIMCCSLVCFGRLPNGFLRLLILRSA